MIRSWLTDTVGVRHPIIQGGMGPYSTNELCAAVANAGGLGIVSLMGMGVRHCDVTPVDPVVVFGEGTTEEYVGRSLARVKERTRDSGGVFGVNCPVPAEFTEAARLLLGAVLTEREADPELRKRLRVVITSAGDPAPWAGMLGGTGLVWLHVVPSIGHVRRAEEADVDAIVASGHEGGGHIAWQPVHSMVLVPGVVDATSLPVVAAGGFCDGRGLAAAFALGAVGVQMGTRFIATRECDFWDVWKRGVLDSSDADSLVARGMFGPMRMVRNRLSETLARRTAELAPGFLEGRPVGLDAEVLALEKEGLAALVRGDAPEDSLMLSGEVAARIHDLPTVAELIERIVAEAEEVVGGLPGRLLG